MLRRTGVRRTPGRSCDLQRSSCMRRGKRLSSWFHRLYLSPLVSRPVSASVRPDSQFLALFHHPYFPRTSAVPVSSVQRAVQPVVPQRLVLIRHGAACLIQLCNQAYESCSPLNGLWDEWADWSPQLCAGFFHHHVNHVDGRKKSENE